MKDTDFCNINTCSALYTDKYELAMGQAYYKQSRHQLTAVFDYFFRKFIEDEGKDPIIGTDEIMTIVNDQCMRVFDRGFTVDTENVNGTFGKIFVKIPDDEGGLVQVERRNVMADIHNLCIGKQPENRPFDGTQIMIL